MNKVIKVGLFLIIVGIVAFVVFSVLDNKFPGFADEEFTLVEKTYDADRYSDFAIALINHQVIIAPSESGQIEIKYYESEHLYVTVTEGEEALTMEAVSERTLFGFLVGWAYLLSPEYTKFYLYLPSETEYELVLSTSNGDISLTDYHQAKLVELSSSNGRITMEDVTVSGPVALETSNGRIILTDLIVAGDIDAQTSNGKIELSNVEGGDVNCKSLNGDIQGTGLNFVNLDADTSNGDINVSVNGVFADYYLKMATTNGKYYLNGARTEQNAYNTSAGLLVDLKTSNGNITVNFSE